jgi:hypothetical protein
MEWKALRDEQGKGIETSTSLASFGGAIAPAAATGLPLLPEGWTNIHLSTPIFLANISAPSLPGPVNNKAKWIS